MTDLWLILGAIGAGIVALLTWGAAQRRKGRADADTDRLRDDLETIRRVQGATDYPDDVDAALDRLRDRQAKR